MWVGTGQCANDALEMAAARSRRAARHRDLLEAFPMQLGREDTTPPLTLHARTASFIPSQCGPRIDQYAPAVVS